MAVKSKDELLAIIKERIGDDTSDEAISFLEDPCMNTALPI